MKILPEEQEAWVQQIKHHWPDPGPPPRVHPVPQTPRLRLRTEWALAAAVLVGVLVVWQLPSPAPEAELSSDWPAFQPRRRSRLETPASPRFLQSKATDTQASRYHVSVRARERISSPPNHWSTL